VRAEDEARGVKPARYHPDTALTEYDRTIEPRPIMRLDEDIFKAMYKVEQMRRRSEAAGPRLRLVRLAELQGAAEDIVQGTAVETDCIFKLRERVRDLAQEMVGLAAKLPPSLEEREDE
jgi:hypothetical protein